jgi:hypothetical protein
MKSYSRPTYDPADVIIGRTLKEWVKYPQLPDWVRSELLSNASQSTVKVSSKFILRMVFKWVLLRGIELSAFLLAEEPLVFMPARENYYFNPPHVKPCVVQSRVRDMFILEAGMIGAI